MKSKLLLVCLLGFFTVFGAQKQNRNRIRPCDKNPWYWQYKGRPVLLLGASDHDNLFQWTPEMLIPHLDAMEKVGANYVRCVMGDSKLDFELFPYIKLENGKYDLTQWNDEFWQRFDFFLKETKKRDIIVQIEIWDRFDYSRSDWGLNPYNPENNVNYNSEESGFSKEYPKHPGSNDQPFFFTTPKQKNNTIILLYQQRYVTGIMLHALKYDHVLYCIDNETSGEEAWSTYWAKYILAEAEKQKKDICVTEMWDNWNLKSEQHKRTFDHPAIYAFCDVSQNSHQTGDALWNNLQWVHSYLQKDPRPLNTIKNYGADTGPHGNTQNDIERWWLHVLGGAASARFHRPPSGLGLSEFSENCICIARKLEQVTPLWEMTPRNDLLEDRKENEAFVTCLEGKTYFIFFPAGGEVNLNLEGYQQEFQIEWVNVRKGEWLLNSKVINAGEMVTLKAPIQSECIAVITRK